MINNNLKTIVALYTLAGMLCSSFAQSSNYAPMLNADEKKSLDAGDIVMRELESTHGRGQTIETIGLINAAGDSLVHLLTNYEAYPEFMSAVDKIEVVGQTETESTLNYTLKPMLGLTKKYRIKIAPVKLEEQVWKIEWFLVEWPGLSPMETIGDTQGYWLIIEQSKHSSLVQYYVYSDNGPVPFGLGSLVDVLGKSSLKDVFNETRAQAEKMILTE